jgi:sulfide:quinone oxidoreductase
MTSTTDNRFRVVIAGGGVAALEAALALRELAGDQITTTVLSPRSDFVYRPMRVREPFAYKGAQQYPLADIAREVGFEFRQDAFKWLDPAEHKVHTDGGEELEYDALLLAMGAAQRPALSHAETIDDARLDEQLHGLIQDVEGGYLHKLAFVVPSRMPWPLPIYELALMTAQRAFDMNANTSITLVTPEDAPLAIFGDEVSKQMERLLEDNGILTITAAHCETPTPGELTLHPGGRTLSFERIIALPELFGPSTPGVPKGSPGGFIPIDSHCQVRGLDRVWAAGDATDFAVKHGGIAAQQADTAAHAIAALAGAPVQPEPFHPIIRAILVSLDKPRYLSAQITGGHGSSSEFSDSPSWSAIGKIDAKYLAPYLGERDRIGGRTA